jgi:hypothetical protein
MKIHNELESLGFFEWLSETHNLKDTDMKPEYLDELPLEDIHRTVCNSMALRWFREKYDLHCNIDPWGYCIFDDNGTEKTGFETYEQSQLECIEELIKIVK